MYTFDFSKFSAGDYLFLLELGQNPGDWNTAKHTQFLQLIQRSFPDFGSTPMTDIPYVVEEFIPACIAHIETMLTIDGFIGSIANLPGDNNGQDPN